jgi:aminopeptidase N
MMPEFVPVHYKLVIEPDLERFRFSGTVELACESSRPADTLVLDALELAVRRCTVRGDRQTAVCDHEIEPQKEELRIRLPRPTAGRLDVVIEYEGVINDRMAGFYRSGYPTADGIRYIAVTQFQESDARRALPCFDHPAAKATFDVEMVIPAGLTAISNTAVEFQHPAEGGRKRVRFQRTPRMSTYLLFFGVGPFEILTDATDSRVRVATLPGRNTYAGYGADFGRRALHYCEQYYRTPYPLGKLDLIAIPDFAFGAMENWGAITFRENLLLHYPALTSRSGEERICEVIAHEIAHQWFGNLVTPSDWKYLWLNESFATYFGYGVVNHYHPEWGIWEQFLSGQTASALARDGLLETFAIEIPGGEHVVINSSTAPIIYSKGGSILRQIQGYIGAERFRDGLAAYLDKHAYGNAASRHLWEAFEAASDKPLIGMMRSWIEQPGHPLVSARRSGSRLLLSQKRFTYLPNAAVQIWDIPVTVQVFTSSGQTRRIDIVLAERQAEIDIGDDVAAYKVNAGQTGFYRVRYLQRADLDALGETIRRQILPPEDRWGLQNDLFALVRSAEIDLADYLALLRFYEGETAFLPLVSIADNLLLAYSLFEDDKRRQAATVGKRLLAGALKRIGLTPEPGEPFTTALLRDQILVPAVIYGDAAAAVFTAARFADLTTGAPVHPDIARSVMQAGALTGGPEALAWLRQRFQDAQSEHERLNVLSALGCFRDWGLTETALQFALEAVPPRNKFVPITAAAANPWAIDYLWDWYVAHIDDFRQFHPLLYERVIGAIVPLAGVRQPERVRAFFDEHLNQHPQLTDVVKLSLEKMEINLRMKNKTGKGS